MGADNPLLREQKFFADAGDGAAARFLEKEGFRPKPPDPCPYVSLNGPGGEPGFEIGLKGTF